jgi:hypothetical protein
VAIRVVSRKNDPLRQQFEEVWEFAEVVPTGAVLRQEREVLAMRWTYRYEMEYLFELAGFEIVAQYSDFQRAPPASVANRSGLRAGRDGTGGQRRPRATMLGTSRAQGQPRCRLIGDGRSTRAKRS